MRTVRIIGWRSVAAALAAAAIVACREETTAPGRCPDFCPTDDLVLVDTVITGIVESDTSVRGYTRVNRSPVMVVASLTQVTSKGIVRFLPMPQRWFPIPNDTTGVDVGTIDSVAIELRLELRDSSIDHNYILVYKLPQDKVDTNATWDTLATYLTAAPIDSIPIPDSLNTGNLRYLLPVGPMTPLDVDSFRVALGFGVRADSNTVAIIGSTELGTPPLLRYYVHGAAPLDTFAIMFPVGPSFDSYVRTPEAAPPPPGTIVVGNQPAARSFLRFDIPDYFIDSATIMRATLHLSLNREVVGFPGESFRIVAVPILRYFGGKSILFPDTSGISGSGSVLSGESDSLTIEMGRVLRLWRGSIRDSLPRAISLMSAAENFTFAEVEAAGAAGGADAPKLRITYVKPFVFGVP